MENGKMKMVAGIASILNTVLPIALLATLAMADVSGYQNGARVQDQDRLRVRDGSCDGDLLQERRC